MSPLIRTVRDLRATMPGVIGMTLALAAAIALVVLVVRGDPKGLSEWGIIIGLFLQAALNLTTEASRHGQRVTDPLIPSRVSTTTTVESDAEDLP